MGDELAFVGQRIIEREKTEIQNESKRQDQVSLVERNGYAVANAPRWGQVSSAALSLKRDLSGP
jgi:hypothetical protein